MSPAALSALALAWVLLARSRRRAGPVRFPGAVHDKGEPRAERRVRSTATSRLGRWALVGLGATMITVLAGPIFGTMVLAAPAIARWRRKRRRQRDAEAAVVAEVPEVVDLMALALGAGLTVTESMAVVGERAPGLVGSALTDAHLAVTQGVLADEALEGARGRCGPPAEGLFAALVAAVRYGTPIGPSLDRLGHEARLDRRRAAEERARKVPVQLLFPLVACVLPAFGLLTVVPLLVNSLGALT